MTLHDKQYEFLFTYYSSYYFKWDTTDQSLKRGRELNWGGIINYYAVNAI